nr:EARP and GARP complex-interacting protein 1 isoform X1 [Macaca fascicularis]
MPAPTVSLELTAGEPLTPPLLNTLFLLGQQPVVMLAPPPAASWPAELVRGAGAPHECLEDKRPDVILILLISLATFCSQSLPLHAQELQSVHGAIPKAFKRPSRKVFLGPDFQASCRAPRGIPASASDSKVLTCAAVWRMPKELESGSHESPDDSSSTAQTLELLCHLDNTAHSNMACVVWEPMGDGKKIISLADNHILLWDLQESSSQAVLASSASLGGKGQLKFTSGRWSPHHNCTQVATANDTTLRGWDTRSMSQIYCIENAHGQLVRDLDFNPNKQYYLASCGDDCKVKFWDTRNVTEPVKTLEEHSHCFQPTFSLACLSVGTRETYSKPALSGKLPSVRPWDWGRLPGSVSRCGTSVTTTLTTSWSSLAAVTAESSFPTWCPSRRSPLATW